MELTLIKFQKNSNIVLKYYWKKIKISGINLPLTFTFLSTKVDSEVFVQKGKRVGSFVVNVTPIGGYPILSIFDTVTYQIYFPNTEMMKLSSFK